MIPYLIPVLILASNCILVWYLTSKYYRDKITSLKLNQAGEKRAVYQCLEKANELKFNKWCKEYDAAHQDELDIIRKARLNKEIKKLNSHHSALGNHDNISELCKPGLFRNMIRDDGDPFDEDV